MDLDDDCINLMDRLNYTLVFEAIQKPKSLYNHNKNSYIMNKSIY